MNPFAPRKSFHSIVTDPIELVYISPNIFAPAAKYTHCKFLTLYSWRRQSSSFAMEPVSLLLGRSTTPTRSSRRSSEFTETVNALGSSW